MVELIIILPYSFNYTVCNICSAWNRSGRDVEAWIAGINLWRNGSEDYTSIPGYITGYGNISLTLSGRASSIDSSSWTYYPAI